VALRRWVEHSRSGADASSLWRPPDEVRGQGLRHGDPGHGTRRVSTLRLWKATAPAHIDLNAFNTGDYARAASAKNEYENISWVLYPNDSTPAGRELRLRRSTSSSPRRCATSSTATSTSTARS
jgi:starch phosphorylase